MDRPILAEWHMSTMSGPGVPFLALLCQGINMDKHIVVRHAFLSDKDNAVLTTPPQTQAVAALEFSWLALAAEARPGSKPS